MIEKVYRIRKGIVREDGLLDFELLSADHRDLIAANINAYRIAHEMGTRVVGFTNEPIKLQAGDIVITEENRPITAAVKIGIISLSDYKSAYNYEKVYDETRGGYDEAYAEYIEQCGKYLSDEEHETINSWSEDNGYRFDIVKGRNELIFLELNVYIK